MCNKCHKISWRMFCFTPESNFYSVLTEILEVLVVCFPLLMNSCEVYIDLTVIIALITFRDKYSDREVWLA